MSEFCEWWWDQPTGQWYGFERPCDGSEPAPNAVPVARFEYSRDAAGCRFDGSDSTDADGSIADYSWTCGDGTGAVGITAEHAYAPPGTYAATLTVTDERGVSAGLSRPVTIEPPNAAPAPHLAVSCTGGSCMLDGDTSFDPDGTIVGYQWQFGDGTAATDRTAQHTYPAADSYTVTLTVTDDDGATATATQTIGLITLTANGHKFRGVQQVVLSWTGASGASFDVFRDGRQIATVTGNANTDNLNRTGSGRYRYKVCESAGSICSNAASVSF
jgi:serine protease